MDSESTRFLVELVTPLYDWSNSTFGPTGSFIVFLMIAAPILGIPYFFIIFLNYTTNGYIEKPRKIFVIGSLPFVGIALFYAYCIHLLAIDEPMPKIIDKPMDFISVNSYLVLVATVVIGIITIVSMFLYSNKNLSSEKESERKKAIKGILFVILGILAGFIFAKIEKML